MILLPDFCLPQARLKALEFPFPEYLTLYSAILSGFFGVVKDGNLIKQMRMPPGRKTQTESPTTPDASSEPQPNLHYSLAVYLLLW